jgi:uncharacterized protein YqeY
VTLFERVQDDFTAARKRRDEIAVTALSMLKTELSRASKEPGAPAEASDQLVQSIVRKEIKRRQEAALAFRSGGREESARKEEAEAEILRGYLPPEMPPDELEREVSAVIAELRPEGPQAFGLVMKAATSRLAGRAEGGQIAAMARKLLA